MTISLAPELEGFINQKIASGLYDSASEVVREALQLLQERDDNKTRRLEELRAEIKLGLDSLKRGEGEPWEIESIKAEGHKRLAAQQGKV